MVFAAIRPELIFILYFFFKMAAIISNPPCEVLFLNINPILNTIAHSPNTAARIIVYYKIGA